MIVHLYALCWNEERMIPFFLRHYEPLVNRIVILDDGSTDRSIDLLRASAKVELGRFANRGDSFVETALERYNHLWKESRGMADWVIVCNIDEFFYHPDLRGYLQACIAESVSLIPAMGFQMVADFFPSMDDSLTEAVPFGMPFTEMDKTAIFNPNLVDEISFEPGRHRARPTGRCKYPSKVEVKLLHFKYLGIEYLTSRNRELGSRLGPRDVKMQWGFQYSWNDEEMRAAFDKVKAGAVHAISSGISIPVPV